MFTKDAQFLANGIPCREYRCTSDGLVAVFILGVWQYYRLNWRTEQYDLVGTTAAFHDPHLEAFDKSEVFPVH